jgi:hypothetical protein
MEPELNPMWLKSNLSKRLKFEILLGIVPFSRFEAKEIDFKVVIPSKVGIVPCKRFEDNSKYFKLVKNKHKFSGIVPESLFPSKLIVSVAYANMREGATKRIKYSSFLIHIG